MGVIKIIRFTVCAFGTFFLGVKLATCRRVSGRYYVLGSVRLRRWYRCRDISHFSAYSYATPKCRLFIENGDFTIIINNVHFETLGRV